MENRDETIIYVDMDHVLCDYAEGFSRQKALFPGLVFPQSQPGMYIGLKPLPGAIDAYHWLIDHPGCPSKVSNFFYKISNCKANHAIRRPFYLGCFEIFGGICHFSGGFKGQTHRGAGLKWGSTHIYAISTMADSSDDTDV